MILRFVFLASCATLLAGCGYSVRYAPINNPLTPQGQVIASEAEVRGPIPPEEVRIFFSQRPRQAYNELGVITIPTSQSAPAEEEIFTLFREKAAEVGGDGVIILDTQTTIQSYPTTSLASGYYGFGVFYTETVRSRSLFRGLVIQFLE